MILCIPKKQKAWQDSGSGEHNIVPNKTTRLTAMNINHFRTWTADAADVAAEMWEYILNKHSVDKNLTKQKYIKW